MLVMAKETKWLSKVMLLNTGSGDFQVNNSIKSENTGGNVSGTISQ